MWRRLTTPVRILAAGWALFIVYAYPGFMSYDSDVQLEQARHIAPLTDWHTPMMAVVWRFADDVISGPFPMLLLQSGTFLIGLYVLLRRVVSPRAAALIASLVLLAPSVLTAMAVIWADSQMAGLVLAGTACLGAQRRRVRLIGLALLGFATAMRYNAAAAVLPIIVGLFVWSPGMTRLRRVAIAATAWVAITAAAFGINALVVEAHVHPWSHSLALRDIAGTLHYARHISDAEILANAPGAPWLHHDKIQIRARNYFHPELDWLEATSGPGAIFDISFDEDLPEEERDAIGQAWWWVVTTYPRAYLRLRAATFIEFLKHNRGSNIWTELVDAPWAEDTLHIRGSHSAVQGAWIGLETALDDTWWYTPGVYFVLSIAFLVLGWRDVTARTVLASGLCYEVATSLVAPGVGYRYSHWMVVCTFVGGVLVFVLRRRRR